VHAVLHPQFTTPLVGTLNKLAAANTGNRGNGVLKSVVVVVVEPEGQGRAACVTSP